MVLLSELFSQTPFFPTSVEDSDQRPSRIFCQYLDPNSRIFDQLPIDRRFLSQTTVAWDAFLEQQRRASSGFPFNGIKKIDHLPTMIDDEDLRRIADYCPSLEEMTLPGCFQVTQNGIRHLQDLKIKRLVLLCLSIADNAMKYLQKMPLNHLGIINCLNLTHAGYEAIFSCGALRSLSLSGAKLNQSQFDWFLKFTQPNFTEEHQRAGIYSFSVDDLNIDSSTSLIFARETDEAVKTQCELNRVAKDVYLNQCQLTAKGFEAIGFKKPLSLSLIDSPMPEGFGFSPDFTLSLRSLTIANLEDARTAYQAFVDCIHLKEIKVMHCGCETTQWLRDLLSCSISIRKLDLCSIKLSDEIIQVIARFSRLERLTLADCFGFFISTLSELKQNRSLRVLRVAASPELDKKAFFESVQGLPLEELHVKGIRLEENDIDCFYALFDRLKYVFINHRLEPEYLQMSLPNTRVSNIVTI